MSDLNRFAWKLLASFVAVLVILTLVTVSWNVGVVGLVAAAGGHVSTVTPWQALWGFVAVRIVGASFKSTFFKLPKEN